MYGVAANVNSMAWGVLEVCLNTLGGIEIRCWGYSTMLGSEVQIRTQTDRYMDGSPIPLLLFHT